MKTVTDKESARMVNMSRKVCVVVSIIAASGIACIDARAQDAQPALVSKDEPAKAAEAPKKKTPADIAAEKAAQAAAAKRAEAAKAAKDKLNNTSWTITLTGTNEKGQPETITDTLRFTESSKIESEKLLSEGFGASNMTVRVKREDRVIWETMQAGKDGALAFWRGDVKRDPKDGTLADTMNGVLSLHKNDKANTVVDYTFVSTGKEIIKPGEPKKAAASTVTAGTATPTATTVMSSGQAAKTVSGGVLVSKEAAQGGK